MAKKAANAKAAEKAKGKFEAEQKATDAKAKAVAKAKASAANGGDAASSLLFEDPEPLPPAYSRIFCIPRDAARVLQIEAIEDEKDPVIKYVGPDYGKKDGKYVTAVPAISNENFYCIPYASQRILELNPTSSAIKGIGDRLLPGCGKYTDAVASEDYRLRLYAAPCRARRVLQVDPVSGVAQEVGKELGDPNDVKEIIVRGLTQKSRKANGIYLKVEDKWDNYPYFQRKEGLPKIDEDEANAQEPAEDSDEDFGNANKLEFYVYCHRQRRWCLGTELGAKWEDAWCWKKGKEAAPPGGRWSHNPIPLDELPDEERERLEKKMKKAREEAEQAAAEKYKREVEAMLAKAAKKNKDVNGAGAPSGGGQHPPLLPQEEEPQKEQPQGEQEQQESEEEKAEESEAEDVGPVREDATRATGFPDFEVKHPPKWWACAYHPNKNRIYAAPYNARRVLRINPAKEGEAEECGPDLGPLPGKYSSMVLAPNGCIFAAPLNASRVLMIDDNGLVSLVGPDFGPMERKYSCLLVANNKLLYAPPLYAERVLEINCAKGESRQIGPVLGMGEAKYCCGASAKNGNIYCPPLEARRVLEIRCTDHEVEEFGLDLGGAEHEKYSSISASTVGYKLYAAPREAHKVIEIDPERYFVREVGPELGRLARKFTCMLPGKRVQPPRPEKSAEEPELDALVGPPAEATPEPPSAEAPAPQAGAPQPPEQSQQPQKPPPRPQAQQSQPQEQSQDTPLGRKPQLY